ncbi:MAG: HEAT repeat domain-containing protein [Gemmatales bacterium]
MIILLKDKDEEVREAAVLALGEIGPDAQEAVKPLMQMLGKASPEMKQEINEAIKQIRTKK